MKRLIFILCLCVAITSVIGSMTIDDFSDKIVNQTSLSKSEVQICLNEANITSINGSVIAQILINGDTSDVQESALKIGCLFACVFKKKDWMNGTTFNVQEIKRELSSKRSNPERTNEIMYTCINQVKNLTNECEVMINFIKCMILEENDRSPN